MAFYWAPKCSGREGVRAVLKTVLDAAEKDVRHPVIITAFGVHESAKLVTRSDDATPQVVIEEDGLRIDSLGACRDTTLELIRTAAADPSSKIHGENVGQQGRNVSTDMDTSNEVLAPSSPLVFLLQNNRFPSDSAQDLFLEDVQRIQRQEVDAWEATHTAERGIFVVNDSVSLYGNLSCFRNANPIHFHEPVKLVEGKMLWDLLALVGRY